MTNEKENKGQYNSCCVVVVMLCCTVLMVSLVGIVEDGKRHAKNIITDNCFLSEFNIVNVGDCKEHKGCKWQLLCTYQGMYGIASNFVLMEGRDYFKIEHDALAVCPVNTTRLCWIRLRERVVSRSHPHHKPPGAWVFMLILAIVGFFFAPCFQFGLTSAKEEADAAKLQARENEMRNVRVVVLPVAPPSQDTGAGVGEQEERLLSKTDNNNNDSNV
jgi:hypothetical protein